MDANTEAIADWINQHQIPEVECLMPDMTDTPRDERQHFLSAYARSVQPRYQFLGTGTSAVADVGP
ncbi:MAG: hypothetical protein ACI9NT_000871 [Bacteroidia bacterium]|jgi:hypothetical protein